MILEGESKSTKKVKLGWVQDFDDDEKIFFIEFSEKKPLYKHIEEKTPFILTDYSKRGKSTVNTRPNQTRFRFFVTRNYGYKCAVCSINIPELLEAIHIRDKKYTNLNLVFNPEFLTERSAKFDFINQSRFILGGGGNEIDSHYLNLNIKIN